MKCLAQPLVLVDVETTGLSPTNSRILEIACIRIEHGRETARFVSLIDPEQSIPKTITALTGIGPAHVEDAPFFTQIADAVEAICEGAVFVAHNARFDYSFVKAEMERAGKKFQKKLLCTVKLSRQLSPEYAKHDLSSLIERHHLSCANRHRALGDTEALAQFLGHVEKSFPASRLQSILAELLKKTSLPPQLDPALVAAIPDTPGVYTFFGKDGETLYIGKSTRLRSRILSHFAGAGSTGKAMRLFRETAHLEYEETVSDLGASLLELYKIKTEAPLLNRMSRRTQALWLLKKHPGPKNSYTRFELVKQSTIKQEDFPLIYGIFRTKRQAKSLLATLCQEHGLCPKLMGLEKTGGECFSHQLQKCSGACVGQPKIAVYNTRLELLFRARKIAAWPGTRPQTLRFYNEEKNQTEIFVVDHWILKDARVLSGESEANLFPFDERATFFDYEIYKVLVRHLLPRLAGSHQ